MRPRFLFILPHEGENEWHTDHVSEQLRDMLPRQHRVGAATLLTSTSCPVIAMPSIEGCLVGTLFSADGSAPLDGLCGAEQLAVMSTHGESLLKQSSGAYVAMWRGCGDRPLEILRDPSACQPAFSVHSERLMAIASDVDCLVGAGLVDLAIHAPGVAQHLRFPLVPNSATCLAAIEEVRPGYHYRVGRRIAAERVWDPRQYADKRRSNAAKISESIDAVVAGHAHGGGICAVELSGGLDSSILSAAFARVTTPIAFHMVPVASDGDERRYAHIVAERFGMPMHHSPIGYDDVDPLAPAQRLTARPTGVLHFRSIDRKFRAAQIETGADFVFSGTGGDSVFGALSSTAPVIDAWLDGGLSLARQTLADIAQIRGVTRWEAMRSLVRRMVRRPGKRWTWPADDRMLGSAGREAPAPDSSDLDGLRPGARAYFASLLRMRALLDAHDRVLDGDIRFPLMAQPVLETCLAVPTWRWMTGGRDRAAAREAFAGRVPDEILQRRGKGRYDSLIVQAYERSKSGLRELLLGGWLAQHRIIDVNAVAGALAAPTTNVEATYSRVIMLAETESWCRMVLRRQSEARSR